MTVGHIFTKIGNFIENRQIFILLTCNCPKLANFENFKTCLGWPFFRGHSVVIVISLEVHCTMHSHWFVQVQVQVLVFYAFYF